MVPALGTRTVAEHRVVLAIFECLALQNAAVFQIEMKDVSAGAVGRRIEVHDHHLACGADMQRVPHASQAAMATMQTADAGNRIALRHFKHPERAPCKERAPRMPRRSAIVNRPSSIGVRLIADDRRWTMADRRSSHS